MPKRSFTKGLGKKPESGFEQAGKLCVTQSGQGDALRHILSSVLHNRDWGSSVLHNNGWRKCRNPALSRQQSSVSQKGRGKSRNQVLNRQKSSVSHNQDKQSSVLHMKLCATQSGLGKLCVTKGPGKRRRLF